MIHPVCLNRTWQRRTNEVKDHPGAMMGESRYDRTGDVLGYARVSTCEQILDLQRDTLAAAGCGHRPADEKHRAARAGALRCHLVHEDGLVGWGRLRPGRQDDRDTDGG